MKNKYAIFQYVADLDSLRVLINHKVIPLVVYTDNTKLPKKFNEIYSLEWFEIGKNGDKVFNFSNVKIEKCFENREKNYLF